MQTVAATVFMYNISILSDKSKTSVQVSVIENICWKELGILVAVWILILALQIGKVRVLFILRYIFFASKMYYVNGFMNILLFI